MGRSSDIFGRVKRNLSKYGVSIVDKNIQDEDIYDSLRAAQNDIIAETRCLEIEVPLTLVIGITDYDLVDLGEQDYQQLNSLKAILAPQSWIYPVEIKRERDWNEVVHSTVNTGYYPSYLASSNQPLCATIMAGKIKFFPAPVSSDTVTLVFFQTSAFNSISSTVDPDIPDYFDKALEYFATKDFLAGANSQYYQALYDKELKTKTVIAHRKHTYPSQQKHWW